MKIIFIGISLIFITITSFGQTQDNHKILSKNDIYGNAVTYMGLDYNFFKLISVRKNLTEELILKHIPFWQNEFAKYEKSLAKLLEKSHFIIDRENTEKQYLRNKSYSFISSTKTILSIEMIQKHIQTYETNNHGLALVLIQGSYDETEKEISMYVVWFDIDTRIIITAQNVKVKSRPTNFAGRWLTAIHDVVDVYTRKYYKKRI